MAHEIVTRGMERAAVWEKEVSRLGESALENAIVRSNAFAEWALAAWWELAGHIFAKYGHYMVTYNASEAGDPDAAA